MIQCLHQGKIYAKRKLQAWRDQKCIPLVGAITQLICADHQNTACRERRYRAQNGKLRKLGRTYRHGTVFAPRKYTKRKLRAWRDQKCIPLVGAITQLICADHQNTACRERRYRAQNGKLRKLGRTYRHGTVFAPRKYTKRKLRAWRDQKCIPLVGAITPLIFAGRQNTLSRGRQYRVQNGKLRELGRTYRHDTVFAPRKYSYQKEATGMERPEMYSASRCNNRTYLCGPSKYPVSIDAV